MKQSFIKSATALSLLVVALGSASAYGLSDKVISDRVAKTWKVFQRSIGEYQGRLVLAPGYDGKIESSKGLTRAEIKKELTKTAKQSYRAGTRRTVAYKPSAEEISAYACLPSMNIGDFGVIHSFKVKKVIGPEEVLVEDLQLIDVESVRDDLERATDKEREAVKIVYKARLAALDIQEDLDDELQGPVLIRGLSTRKMVAKERWTQPSETRLVRFVVAWREVASEEEREKRSRNKEITVLIEADAAMKGLSLTHEKFLALLEDRDLSQEKFLEQYTDLCRDDHDTAAARMLKRLISTQPIVNDKLPELLSEK